MAHDRCMPTTDTTTAPLDDEYDVVIVGARAAGAATAMLLARSGIRVAAIDKSTYGSDTLSTHSIARAGVLLLSRWGVLDALRAADTPVADTMVFNYGPDTIAIDVRPSGDVDGLYSPRRTVLDRSLVDAAVDAGATIRHDTKVTGLVRDERGRVIGIDVDDRGAPRAISARFVVGADGMTSRVAERVGATVLREERAGSGVVYGYFTGIADPNVIENDFRVGRAAGVIPTNNGETCVWIAVPGADFRAEMADGVNTAFMRAVETSRGLTERLDGASLVSRRRSFPGRPGFLRQAWGPGWALVGDSAYFKDPVSAHGLTDALIGADLLAEALVHAVQGGDEWTALADYQHKRNHLADPMMRAVAKVAAYEWDLAGVADAYLEMSAAMRLEWEFLQNRRALVAA